MLHSAKAEDDKLYYNKRDEYGQKNYCFISIFERVQIMRYIVINGEIKYTRGQTPETVIKTEEYDDFIEMMKCVERFSILMY